MLTVLRVGPYRFFFYSSDGSELPHVHVERDRDTAKFWLSPVRLQKSGGFRRHELRRIQQIIDDHREALLRSWDEYFNR